MDQIASVQAAAATEKTTPRLLTVLIRDIAASPDNTRLFDKRDKEDKLSLDELAASIRETGLHQYPKVRPTGGTPPWVLVYGERRLRACRDLLKWTEMTVVVDEAINGTEATVVTVVENLQRRDMHPMDEARGIALVRCQGKSMKQIAQRLGRREAWVKERLKLCDLPERVQDLYRHSTRLTFQHMMGLHEYTHGGRDNKGFPDLICALAESIDTGTNPHGLLRAIAPDNPAIVKRFYHAYSNWDGRWSENHFDSKAICTRCPFAAYRESDYGGDVFCLMPSHYEKLQAQGKDTYDAAQAQATAKAAENGEAIAPHHPTWPSEPTKSAAQKGQETRQRHLKQRNAYAPTVAAIERAIDMIPAADGIDLAVFCAYTLTAAHVDSDAIQHVTARHGLTAFPGTEPTPSTSLIERLRQIEPVQLVRYTLEALLLTQAHRARDYDPGKVRADPVLALYVPGHETTGEDVAA